MQKSTLIAGMTHALARHGPQLKQARCRRLSLARILQENSIKSHDHLFALSTFINHRHTVSACILCFLAQRYAEVESHPF